MALATVKTVICTGQFDFVNASEHDLWHDFHLPEKKKNIHRPRHQMGFVIRTHTYRCYRICSYSLSMLQPANDMSIESFFKTVTLKA